MMIFERNSFLINFNVKQLLVLLIIITSSPLLDYNTLTAQSDVTQDVKRGGETRYQAKPYFARRKMAVKAAKELKKGTLIVRLVSFNEKIEHLQKTGKKEKAQKEKLVIQEIHKSFVTQFSEDYHFSEVVFCYGKDLDQFLDGKNKDIFLNQNLEIDTSIKLKEGPFYFLASQANDSYYLYDKNFQRIPEPAPHAQ